MNVAAFNVAAMNIPYIIECSSPDSATFDILFSLFRGNSTVVLPPSCGMMHAATPMTFSKEKVGPALCSFGQHRALEAVARCLLPTERLFAFLDDWYVMCRPDRVVDVHHILAVELWSHAKIQIQHGKTQGVEPRRSRADGDRDIAGSSAGQRPRRSGPCTPGEQGMKILGTPLGHPSYVQSFLRAKTDDHTLMLGTATTSCPGLV